MFHCINLTLSRILIRPQPLRQSLQFLHVTQINPAARKGTREKARKKKVKVEIKKVGFIPHNQRKSANAIFVDKHIDDSWKATSTDNVYPGRYYQWRLYRLAEAIQCHRETHDPTMYDVPNAQLNVSIELNMQGEKITRFVSNFQKLAMIEYPFEHGENRSVLAFANDEEQHKEALAAGAIRAGGIDLIKIIHKGELRLSDYPYIVAHPNIMPQLITLRGLLKKKFPNQQSETLGTNLEIMVKKCLNGIHYRAVKDENQENFGLIDTSIGLLNMPTEHLVSNFNNLLLSVNSMRPKRDGKFITRVIFTSPPSKETLKIDPKDFPFDDYDRKSGQKVEKLQPSEELEAQSVSN